MQTLKVSFTRCLLIGYQTSHDLLNHILVSGPVSVVLTRSCLLSLQDGILSDVSTSTSLLQAGAWCLRKAALGLVQTAAATN